MAYKSLEYLLSGQAFSISSLQRGNGRGKGVFACVSAPQRQTLAFREPCSQGQGGEGTDLVIPETTECCEHSLLFFFIQSIAVVSK